MTDNLSGLDSTPKRIYKAKVSGRILADCGGWIPPQSEFMKPKYSRGIRLCCALTNWSPPPTRRTTLTVLGPDGFDGGQKKANKTRRSPGPIGLCLSTCMFQGSVFHFSLDLLRWWGLSHPCFFLPENQRGLNRYFKY